MICSSCGFPISDFSPVHNVETIFADGRTRYVCDRCWHDPALWFLPRELEKHGSYQAVVEAAYRRFLGIPAGQTTLGSIVPDYVREALKL